MLLSVQFKTLINVGGVTNELERWDRKKHGDAIEATERGPFILLTCKGKRIRVPISNVAAIEDDGVDDPKEKR